MEKEMGKNPVWRIAFVIYSTFGSFLTNYTQASIQGCKYSWNHLNTSQFVAFSKKRRTQRNYEEHCDCVIYV